MLSMVSVNRFISTAVIPFVIVAYGVFLLIDRNQLPANKDPIQGIQKIGSIDGLLFGGSNAVYSLSAEFLSYDLGIKWYNASVLGELWSVKRHKDFIRDLSAHIERTKVRYVVYSSIAPYRKGLIASSKSSESLGIRLKPKISVLGYLRHRPFSNSNFSLHINRFGDMLFETINCVFTAELIKHEREDEDVAAEFLVDYASFFASLFPNASILIVLPSEYYGALSFDDSIFEQTVRTKFYNALNAKNFTNPVIKIIFQPSYSRITQLCDAPPHANADGRIWRTRNLIGFIRTVFSATAQ